VFQPRQALGQLSQKAVVDVGAVFVGMGSGVTGDLGEGAMTRQPCSRAIKTKG
jgi:hypothetical protein